MEEKSDIKCLLIWGAVILLLIWFLILVKAVLLPFIVGIMVAYFLDPAADKLEEWGLSRNSATLVITVLFFVVGVSLVVAAAPVVYGQLTELFRELPNYVSLIREKFTTYLNSFMANFGEDGRQAANQAVTNMSDSISNLLSDMLTGIVESGTAFFSMLSLLFITPVVTFYMLRDWDRMIAKLHKLLPRKYASTIEEQMHQIDITLAGFLRGQMNVCMIVGSYYAIALSLLGLKFGIAIGFMAGILVIIPYVGTIFSAALAITLAYLQFEPEYNKAIAVAVIFIVGQVVDGSFITPRLVGKKVGLHPVWIIFGMLAGGALFGFIGVLISVPTTAVIGVLVRFLISRYVNSRLYGGEYIQQGDDDGDDALMLATAADEKRENGTEACCKS